MMTWVSICIKWLSHSKWPSEWSKESASNFAVTLNIPLWKPFWWFRRPQLWATGDWQLHHDNVCSHASRLVQSSLAKHHITQVTQPLYSPDLVPCDFWLFPKLNSPLKGKKFQTIDEIQESMTGQPMATGRAVWGPRCLLWRRLRCHCTMYNVSCILYLSLFFIFQGCIPSGQASYNCEIHVLWFFSLTL